MNTERKQISIQNLKIRTNFQNLTEKNYHLKSRYQRLSDKLHILRSKNLTKSQIIKNIESHNQQITQQNQRNCDLNIELSEKIFSLTSTNQNLSEQNDNLRSTITVIRQNNAKLNLQLQQQRDEFKKNRFRLSVRDVRLNISNIPEVEQQLLESLLVLKRVSSEKLTEDNLCVVCKDEKKTIALMPCGHMCICEVCSNKIYKCPLCRKVVKEKARIFL